MPTYRIERTEFHTRVFFVTAENEDDALDAYVEEEDSEEHSYHSGQPDVRITRVDETETV